MQASDDITQKTQSIIESIEDSQNVLKDIMSNSAYSQVFNPSTNEYVDLDMKAVKCSNGAFHIKIKLMPMKLATSYMLTEDRVYELNELHEEIFCEICKTMIDKVLKNLQSQYQSSWYYFDREDCYEFDNGMQEGEGMMVLVLKKLE